MRWPWQKPSYVPTIAARTPRAKVEFHIARFTAAVEQNDKLHKIIELQANLDYWLAIQAAEARLESLS